MQTVLHTGLRRGDAAVVTDTVPDLLGRPPRTLDDYVTDHLDLWRTPVTDDTTRPAVERMHPPKGLWDLVVNPAVRTLLRTPAHRLVDDALLLLTFRGRRSGTPYTVPVGHHDIDGHPAVLTNSGWRVNFRGGHPLTVRWRGHVRTGTGTLDEDPDHVAHVYHDLITDVGWEHAGRRLGVRINVDRHPTHDELADAARTFGLSILHLHLDPTA